jgi:hypothetical protein
MLNTNVHRIPKSERKSSTFTSPRNVMELRLSTLEVSFLEGSENEKLQKIHQLASE